jgi:hypothetical protein
MNNINYYYLTIRCRRRRLCYKQLSAVCESRLDAIVFYCINSDPELAPGAHQKVVKMLYQDSASSQGW